jgi:hypothetical protein
MVILESGPAWLGEVSSGLVSLSSRKTELCFRELCTVSLAHTHTYIYMETNIEWLIIGNISVGSIRIVDKQMQIFAFHIPALSLFIHTYTHTSFVPVSEAMKSINEPFRPPDSNIQSPELYPTTQQPTIPSSGTPSYRSLPRSSRTPRSNSRKKKNYQKNLQPRSQI